MENSTIIKEKKPKGIKFYKKIWYSIAKFDKYEKMANEGVKTAMNYLYILTAIFAVVFTILQVIHITKAYRQFVAYIDNSVPELSYKSGILDVQATEVLELNDESLKNMLGGNLVIDMVNDFDETLEPYKPYLDKTEGTLILLKNKFVAVNYNGNSMDVYDYNPSLDMYLSKIQSPNEFSKQDVINYFSKINYATYLIEYFIVYFVSYLIVFLVFILMATIIGFICTKVFKIQLKLKQIFALSIYAYTLSIIIILIYSMLNTAFGITIKYIQIAYMLIAYIYLTTAIVNKKNKTDNKEG